MRREFTLQLYDTDNVCERPGECGKLCYCGNDYDSHGFGDGHSPVAMMCRVCLPPITCAKCGHEDSREFMHLHICVHRGQGL